VVVRHGVLDVPSIDATLLLIDGVDVAPVYVETLVDVHTGGATTSTRL